MSWCASRYRKREMRHRGSAIHTYLIYALFDIPRDRWLLCLPWQTTANHEEAVQIRRFLSRREQSRHPDPPSEGDGKRTRSR